MTRKSFISVETPTSRVPFLPFPLTKQGDATLRREELNFVSSRSKMQPSWPANRKVSPLSVPLIRSRGIKAAREWYARIANRNALLTRQDGTSIISCQRKIFQLITMKYLFRVALETLTAAPRVSTPQSITKRERNTARRCYFFYPLLARATSSRFLFFIFSFVF